MCNGHRVPVSEIHRALWIGSVMFITTWAHSMPLNKTVPMGLGNTFHFTYFFLTISKLKHPDRSFITTL